MPPKRKTKAEKTATKSKRQRERRLEKKLAAEEAAEAERLAQEQAEEAKEQKRLQHNLNNRNSYDRTKKKKPKMDNRNEPKPVSGEPSGQLSVSVVETPKKDNDDLSPTARLAARMQDSLTKANNKNVMDACRANNRAADDGNQANNTGTKLIFESYVQHRRGGSGGSATGLLETMQSNPANASLSQASSQGSPFAKACASAKFPFLDPILESDSEPCHSDPCHSDREQPSHGAFSFSDAVVNDSKPSPRRCRGNVASGLARAPSTSSAPAASEVGSTGSASRTGPTTTVAPSNSEIAGLESNQAASLQGSPLEKACAAAKVNPYGPSDSKVAPSTSSAAATQPIVEDSKPSATYPFSQESNSSLFSFGDLSQGSNENFDREQANDASAKPLSDVTFGGSAPSFLNQTALGTFGSYAARSDRGQPIVEDSKPPALGTFGSYAAPSSKAASTSSVPAAQGAFSFGQGAANGAPTASVGQGDFSFGQGASNRATATLFGQGASNSNLFSNSNNYFGKIPSTNSNPSNRFGQAPSTNSNPSTPFGQGVSTSGSVSATLLFEQGASNSGRASATLFGQVASVGEGVSAGEDTSFGQGASLGQGATVWEGASLGQGTPFGQANSIVVPGVFGVQRKKRWAEREDTERTGERTGETSNDDDGDHGRVAKGSKRMRLE